MVNYNSNYLFSETYLENLSISENGILNKDQISKRFKIAQEWNGYFLEKNGDYNHWVDDFIDSLLNSVLDYNLEQENRIRYLKDEQREEIIALGYVLEKKEDINSKTKGRFYAYQAVEFANENNLDWIILTNGYKWRIYNTNDISPYEHYLEINIEKSLLNDKPDESFNFFINFFHKEIFKKRNNQKPLIEKKLQDSNEVINSIENHLRDKAELILNDLCNGFKENMSYNYYSEEDRRSIYVDSIIYLYRLLFFGYAEARGLLPSNQDDENYKYNSFSVICKNSKEMLNSSEALKVSEEYSFWNKIDEYLRIYVDENYDGGLFKNNQRPILNEYKIKNKYLMKAIAEINYFKNDHNDYVDKINYKDLTVRNLGSIYEGLLEYNLFVAEEDLVKKESKNKVRFKPVSKNKVRKSDVIIKKGQVYISDSYTERKQTGSYYTPEDVVEYIVSNTVTNKIKEMREELFQEIKNDLDQIEIEVNDTIKKNLQYQVDSKIEKFIEKKILDINIIDSAMGSGHFLVNTAYKITNLIIDILLNNNWINENLKIDITYLRRKVVENCIFGIDINELAVYLSRLSLWLISASRDKPLSFIDHHLKTGNSILGIQKEDVKLDLDKEKVSLFDVNEQKRWEEQIYPKYKKLNKISGTTMEEVEEKNNIYNEINQFINITKKKYDYYLSKKLKKMNFEEDYNEIMLSNNIDRFEKKDIKPLIEYAKQKKFFHWELEFPNVMRNGGFDIFIGNPPYVEENHKKFFGIKKTKKSHNLYAYIIERTIKNVNNNSKMGIILPSSSVTSNRRKGLQDLIINNSDEIKVSTFDDRPGKLFPQLEHMRAAIIFSDFNFEDPQKRLYTTKYNRWYSENRSELFDNIEFVKLNQFDFFEGSIPKVGSEIEKNILKKVFSFNKKIKDYITKENGQKVFYGSGVQYWIKSMNMNSTDVYEDIKRSSGEKDFSVTCNNDLIVCILNSSLFYWYFVLFSDCRNLTKTVIKEFPFDIIALDKENINRLVALCNSLMDCYVDNSEVRSMGSTKYVQYRVKKCKNIIDKIDETLGAIYGLTEEEINFIKRYDIKFRT